MAVYKSYEEFVQLLGDKGFLNDNFKPAHLIGYWLREFEQQYDQSRYLAAETGQPQRFAIDTYGKFNATLETIKFTFEFEFSLLKNALRLKSLTATLGVARKPYKPSKTGEPRAAAKVASDIKSYAARNKSFDLHNALQKEYKRQRKPEKDLKRDLYDDSNPYDGTRWQEMRLSSDDDRRPYKREHHKMRLKR